MGKNHNFRVNAKVTESEKYLRYHITCTIDDVCNEIEVYHYGEKEAYIWLSVNKCVMNPFVGNQYLTMMSALIEAYTDVVVKFDLYGTTIDIDGIVYDVHNITFRNN